jgi:hypothetical protein
MPATTKQVTISIPGWLSVTLEPNDSERNAAWELYVELATRISSRQFDREHGSLRAALESLYAIFTQTRTVLRAAGPDVAKSQSSFGPFAIRFLTDVLGPFLLQWHEPLRAHESLRPETRSITEHERAWDRHGELVDEFEKLRSKTSAYVVALAQISGVYHSE